MRAWLVVALALGACARPTPPPSTIPPVAAAVEARPIERVMRERIAFEPSDKGGPPPGVAVEELGRLPGKGRWIALHDDALDAYEKAGNRLPLLYFSREAYQKAIRKLTGPQIEEAMAMRLRYWSSGAMNHAPGLLDRDYQALLAALSTAFPLAPPRVQPALSGLMQRTLTRMAAAPISMFSRMTLPAAISHVQEEDVTRIADAASLATEVQGASAIADATANKTYVAAYDEMLVRLGASDRSMSGLQVTVKRVFFIGSLPPSTVHFLNHERGEFRVFRDGALSVSSRRELELIFTSGEKMEVLGFSPSRYHEDRLEVTRTQGQIALEETFTLVRTSPLEAVRDHWTRLFVSQAVLRNALWQAAKSSGSPLSPAIAAQVTEETATLRRMLANSAPTTFAECLARIQELLAHADLDAGFITRRATAEGRGDILDYAVLQRELAAERAQAQGLGEQPR